MPHTHTCKINTHVCLLFFSRSYKTLTDCSGNLTNREIKRHGSEWPLWSPWILWDSWPLCTARLQYSYQLCLVQYRGGIGGKCVCGNDGVFSCVCVERERKMIRACACVFIGLSVSVWVWVCLCFFFCVSTCVTVCGWVSPQAFFSDRPLLGVVEMKGMLGTHLTLWILGK